MERITTFTPAYDNRLNGGGQHGVDLRMVLKGEQGAVQFVLFTGWSKSLAESDSDIQKVQYPLPADLGYHSKIPLFEKQIVSDRSCIYCDGAPCYYDGSTIDADIIFKKLILEGSESLWKELEYRYRQLFGELQ